MTWTPTPTRPCGCDWDTAVFGHMYCWTQPFPGGRHVICRCTLCHCHDRT